MILKLRDIFCFVLGSFVCLQFLAFALFFVVLTFFFGSLFLFFLSFIESQKHPAWKRSSRSSTVLLEPPWSPLNHIPQVPHLDAS